MCCIIAALVFIGPRAALFILWLSNYLKGCFETTLWPVLGFIFMPWTTIAYAFIMHENNHQVSGGYVILLIVAVLFDLGGTSACARSRSQ